MMGAERSLVMLCGLITALIIISGGYRLYAIGGGAIFWFLGFWVVCRMAKADTQMSLVYQRHIRYRSYYSARGCVYAVLPPLSGKAKG